VAEKKSALTKPKAAAKAAPAAAKKAAPAPRRGEPAPKKAPPPKAAAKAAKPEPKAKAAPAPKAAAKASPPKPAPVAKAAPKAAAKPEKKADAKAAAKPAPAPKAAKPDPKAKAPPPKPAKIEAKAKPAPEPKKPAPKAAKPAPEPKPAKVAPVKAEKPPKPEKPPKAPKPPKPPKLAPVAAALAKPMPAKPMAVAAGRAQPITRAPLPTPVRAAPKPLVAPKPVAVEPEVVGELQPVPAFKAKAAGAKGMILVGAIGGAFGVKGEVRLRAFTERKDGVIAYGPLYGEDGKVLLKPKSWRELKDGVAVVAPEIKTREQAEAMKGTKLFVPRANLPATAEDEFYIVDLLGCRAETVDGQVLGDIVAVWNFGAGDIIEYRPPNGGPNVQVTFTKASAPLVDLAGKRVVLDPPAPEVMEK
jgi:16S rRNA processing protein RimM